MTTRRTAQPQRRTATIRGTIVAVALVVGATTGPVAGAATTTSAGSTTATTAPSPIGTPDIIPLPNSGRAPETPGDRGGWQQQVLFFSICGAIVVGIGLMWRESRVKRRRQGRLPDRSAKSGG